MGIFGRKSDEQKQEESAIEQRRKMITDRLKGVEKVSGKKAAHMAAQLMDDGESVEYAAAGEHGGTPACLVLTDRRVIIGVQGALTHGSVELAYSDIDRVDVGMGLSGSQVTLFHGSQQTTLDKSPHGKLDEVRTIVQSHRPDGSAMPSTGVDDLTKLAELHAQDILTDEEFAAAKRKALGI